MEGFVYVVNPVEIPRVAFGSSIEREVLPLKGPCLSPFMRQIQGDLFTSPGPAARTDTRDLMKLGWPSKYGHSAFASKISRLEATRMTSATEVPFHDVEPHRIFKPAHKPFNVGASRTEKVKFLTPSPLTYPIHVPRPTLQISTAFGTKRRIFPVIKVICNAQNIAKCQKCEKTPYGDYWHDFGNNLDMCRLCMHKVEKIVKSCTATAAERMRLRRAYKDYQRVRYCDFYHKHPMGTVAAVQTLPSRIFRLKMKKENYLTLYM